MMGGISPIRKTPLKYSNSKKKISIKKHIEGSLKKKKSQEMEIKQSFQPSRDTEIGKFITKTPCGN